MLYIDSPVGVGYSYSDRQDVNNDHYKQEGYAEDLYQFMEQFFLLFPDSYNKELYIGGQSYAGKYVPSFAYRIHRAVQRRESNLPLTGIYMGGPFYAPEVMLLSTAEYPYTMGAASRAQNERFREKNWHYFTKIVSGEIQLSEVDVGDAFDRFFRSVSLHNYVTGDFANQDAVQDIVRSDRVRQAVHVGDQPYVVYNTSNRDVFGPDFFTSTRAKVGALLDSGLYKVLIFNGDFDVITSSRMVEEAVLQTAWSGQAEYVKVDRTNWHGPATSSSYGSGPRQLYGFYSRVGVLCRVVVHGAGHQVPHDQPEVSRLMMEQFVHSGCVSSLDD